MVGLVPTIILASAFSAGPSNGLASLPSLAVLQEAGGVDESRDVEPVPGFGQLDALSRGTSITFDPQYAHVFNSEVDDNQGEFNLDRLRLRLQGRTVLNDTWELGYGFKYQFDGFGFAETGTFGASPSPWTDIHTVQFHVGATVKFTEQWRGFGGGQFRFARETGAGWSDSFEGGGAFGASYSFSRTLTLGGGLGVETQLEDGLLFYPVIVIDWQIADRWLLTTRMSTGWADQTGIQLVYDWTETLDVSVGVAYDYQRFRLNDDGPSPGGVGLFTATPVYAMLTWIPSSSVHLSVFAGANTMGELELRNSSGNSISKKNYGLGFLFGAQASVTF